MVIAPSHDSRHDLLLHPAALVAAGVLLINDHLLKVVDPSSLTGKLSDIAGLVLAPLLLATVLTKVSRMVGRETRSAWPIASAVAATACGFAAVKLLPSAADAYRAGLGYLQWPVAAAGSLSDLPPLRPVLLVADASDLVALPALIVPFVIALNATSGRPAVRRQRLGALVLVVCSIALLATSPAYPEVSDNTELTAALTIQNPNETWVITLTATAGALPTTDAWAGVSATQPTGPNEERTLTTDDIALTLVGLHPDAAVTAALEANQDEMVADLEWHPFGNCDAGQGCSETYRLDARWLDPTTGSLSLIVHVGVSIPYEINASIPSGAQVRIDVGAPHAASP